ncbi:MAG: hypothetical protein A2Y22_08390 [Clostridiales bacterium GWD2_32_59]|nr:MAG: hypothetical protein A2Y22_08390 [Clostridiales bacterium GWD2_32_59]
MTTLEELYKIRENLYAGVVEKANGERKVRLYMKKEGKHITVTEFFIDEIQTKIFEIQRFGKVYNPLVIRDIIKDIQTKHDTLPVIPSYENMKGFIFDEDGNATAYVGSSVIDTEGEEIIADVKDTSQKRGTLVEWVNRVKKIMANNKIIQLAVLVSLASIVVGLLKKTPIIMGLIGKSRTGKTTLTSLCTSVYSSTTDANINLTFSSTDNYMVEKIADAGNALIAVDDASLNARDRNFMDTIYLLFSGTSIGRIIKGFANVVKHWYLNIVITAEKSILLNGSKNKKFDAKLMGIVPRLLEIRLCQTSIFSDASQANEVQQMCKEQYGTAGLGLAKFILKNETVATVQKKYEEELTEIRKHIPNEPILQATAENIAIIAVTAKLTEQALGLIFDIKEIKEFMMSIYQSNLNEFKEYSNSNSIVNKIYPELIQLGNDEYKEYIRKNNINIPVNEFNSFVESKGYKPSEVKEVLSEDGMLIQQEGYTYTISHQGKALKVICIKNTLVEVE